MSQEQLVVDPKRSKLVKPDEKTPERTVKIKTLRPIMIDDAIIPEGKEVMVSAEEAKQFCDLSFGGHYAFEGERREPIHHDIKRAVRV